MKRLLFIVFTLIIFVSCSTKKKGFLNRAYHNTTARYNGYFNARESIKEGLNAYKETRTEDFDKILPVFIMPSEDEASSLFPNMNTAIEKTEKVITRHSMEIRGKEYCKWIDNNYIAKGIGHFYKREFKQAASTFSFVAKRYKEAEEEKAQSLSWLVRTHIEAGDINEASLVIPVLNKIQDLKRKTNLLRQKTNAAYQIAKENYTEAISHLNQAIGLERKRREKVRMYFIKAQLYQRMGNSNDAITAYRYVVKKSPDYDLAFNAGISQATAVEGSANSFAVKKDLEKLLKDDKNIEYHDQIYYALAEIAFTEREYDEAVLLLEKSIAASISNNRQKGKSFYKLAKYYFSEKLYQPASVYYDSSLAIFPNNHPEYDEIKSKSKNLKELVVHLNKIDLNDSLLVLANLDPEDLDDKLNEVIRTERERLLREQREKEIKAQKALAAAKKPAGGSGTWYFYNPKAKLQGFNDFKDQWGDRALADNWRRKNKGFQITENNPVGTSGLNGGDPGGDLTEIPGLPTLAELRKPIPNTVAGKNKMVQETKDALYQSGLVYKENFKDFDNAIEAFENLLSRYDTTFYRLPAYYQLYRLYLIKENQTETEFFSFDTRSSSFYYKDLILYEYPDSEFAQLIRNPDAVKEKSKANKEALSQYNKAYLAYQIDSLTTAMQLVEEGISNYGENDITPKFYFLKGRIYSELKDIENFEKTLSFLVQRYNGTPEGKEAKRLLDLLRKKLAADQGNSNSNPANPAPADSSQAVTAKYKDTPQEKHFFIVIIPDGSMNPNRAKIEISNFNGRFFSNKKMDISQTFLSNDLPIIIVKGIDDKKEAKSYYSAFSGDKNELRVIARSELDYFSISQSNFKTLFQDKKVEDYLKFFKKSYL